MLLAFTKNEWKSWKTSSTITVTSQDGSIGTVIRLRTGIPRIRGQISGRGRDFSAFQNIQNCTESHPSSSSRGTGAPSSGEGVDMAAPLHQCLPTLRTPDAVLLLTHIPSWVDVQHFVKTVNLLFNPMLPGYRKSSALQEVPDFARLSFPQQLRPD